MNRILIASIVALVASVSSVPASAQITATVPKGSMTPPWGKGIQPISRESYWNAVECGKQGGARPLCLFYDADLCRNEDFALTLFTPYKQVAYQVWQEVKDHRPAPTPSYTDAQKTRITLGITPVQGSKDPIASLSIKRGGRIVKPATQSVDSSGGRFIFDFSAFAPTEALTIEMVGRSKTLTCLVPTSVLKILR